MASDTSDSAYSTCDFHLPYGTILAGRYRIGEVLGEGGYGITYTGFDLRLEMKVAVKEYFPVNLVFRDARESLRVKLHSAAVKDDFEKGLERFLEEARIMARLDKQPEIVDVRDFFEANGTAAIVMEYVDGISLKEYMEQQGGRIGSSELFDMLTPLFGALSVMHGEGLIHRDISPDNIMVEEGRVKLLDFGCARESDGYFQSMTATLKRGFGPIEQYQKNGQGPWTDVYGLSATIYNCLTGICPQASLDRILNDELVPPRQLGVDISERQEKALLRGMEVNPKKRYRSVEELYEGLYWKDSAETEIGEGDGGTDQGIQSSENAETRRKEDCTGTNSEIDNTNSNRRGRRKVCMVIAAAAAVLIVVAVVGFAIWFSGRDSHEIFGSDSSDLSTVVMSSNSEEELLELLADESVGEVIVPEGTYFYVSKEDLVITKTLTIEENAGFDFYTSITVSAGGTLCLYGHADGSALVHVENGGSLYLGDTAEFSCGLFWLENEDSFSCADGDAFHFMGTYYESLEAVAASPGYVLNIDENEIFADAAHVTNSEELEDALNFSSALVIDADMTLSELECDVPLMISEGVSLSFTGDGLIMTDEGSSAVLINKGTLNGSFSYVQRERPQDDSESTEDICTLINYGSMKCRILTDSSGQIINYDNMELEGDVISFNIYNMGEMFTSLEKMDTSIYGRVSNCGTWTITGRENTNIDFLNTENSFAFYVHSSVYNAGTINLEQTAVAESDSVIENYGSIVLSSSEFKNSGLLDLSLTGSEFLCGDGSVLDNGSGLGGGVVMYNDETVTNLDPESSDGYLYFVHDGDEVRDVFSYEDLEDALAAPDEECRVIIVGADIVCTNDITISGKTLVVDESQQLKMASGRSLLVEGDGALYLRGGTVAADEGAVILKGNATAILGGNMDAASVTVLSEYARVNVK